MKYILPLCLFLLFCFSLTSCASIQQYVDAAVLKGANSITIPPGIYITSLGAIGVHLNITSVNNFAVYAYNVTMMCTVRARAIDISYCTNVSIYGIVVDYDPLTFTQGTIVDLNNNYLDIKVHSGYPVIAWDRINVINPKTMFFRDGMGFMWDITANISSPGIIRVYRTSGEGFFTAQIGDYATLPGGPDGDYACHAIGINFCASITVTDVTVHCAPGFGLAEWGGEGGLILENFQLIPGPLPANATVPRLQTSSWDGIEHTSMKKGPWVNRAVVELAGDDTWSTVSDAWQVAEIDAANKQITFNGGAPYTIYAGDTLRLRNEVHFPNEEVVVVKIDMNSYSALSPHTVYCSKCAAKAIRKLTSSPNFTVSVDRAIPSNWQVNDYLYSTDRQASGFIIQNSYVRSKGRGALVKAPNGLIQNNYFYGGTAGVEVSPEISGATGSDACVGYNLVVRNNTIVHTGYHETFNDATYGADGAVAFFSYASSTTIRNPPGFFNMVVEGNRFESVNGINIGVASSNGVVIANNSFADTLPVNYSVQGQSFGFVNGYVVFLAQSNNISLSGNVVYGAPSVYKLGNLFVSNASDVTGANGGIISA